MASRSGRRPFAPPYLVAGDLCIAQTANILLFLADRHGLCPPDAASRHFAHQLELTIVDATEEAHDVHHPVSGGLYYEEQKAEALRAANAFRAERMPKFLGYFERVLARNPGGPGHLVGRRTTTADLSLFQVVEGLRYAFPRAMARLEPKHARVIALHDRIAARPRIAAYLRSKRRIAFNENGIFRHYPELDRPGLDG